MNQEEISTRIFIGEYRMEKTLFNENVVVIGAYPDIEKLDENDRLRECVIKTVTDTSPSI